MRFELPADKKLVHTLVIPMRWGDMDAMGHLNNAMYLRLFETVRIDWFSTLGLNVRASLDGPMMVNAFVNYTRAIEYPCNVVARHFVSAPGRTSFKTYFEFEREDMPDVVHANGGATLVWVDHALQRSAPIPAAVRAKLGLS
jgi:acyl-CoA thioester hydrolase